MLEKIGRQNHDFSRMLSTRVSTRTYYRLGAQTILTLARTPPTASNKMRFSKMMPAPRDRSPGNFQKTREMHWSEVQRRISAEGGAFTRGAHGPGRRTCSGGGWRCVMGRRRRRGPPWTRKIVDFQILRTPKPPWMPHGPSSRAWGRRRLQG